MTLRKMSVEDIPAGLRLCRASGWNQVEDDWRVFLTSPGSGGFVAESGGEVVGTVAHVRHEPLVWIAMMLVDPEKRRQGIGKGLMEEAMRAVEEAPCVGLDASLSGEPLYRGFGFVSHSRSVRMKTSITSVRVAAHPESVRRMERADLPAVLQLDRGVFGADRGRLLASLFERAPECAWVAADAHALRGYVMGRPGHLYHQVGPVVAPDIGTARALVARCCSELNGRQAAIDATRFDAEWMQSLGSLGFVEERPFIRMFRGADVQPGLTGQQYAIAGPEFA